jgi:uncharacterized protein (TIGR01777 family)
METVLITGGTGLVGKHLSNKLQEKGYSVSLLSRTSQKDFPMKTFGWNYQKQTIDNVAFNSVDYIIHLAGANIGEKRWTNRRKQLIIDSRVKTGQLLFDRINEQKKSLKAFITASAIGYYGTITTDKIFRETDFAASDFLGNVCNQWEEIADKFEEKGIRTVKIRTGVVLTKKYGALSKMITPVKMGIGSAIGTGKQYLPWIHIDDLCEIYIKAIEDNKMSGVYNAVAPDYKTNKDFTKILAFVLNKSFWFPNIPAILMKVMFGEMSNLLLKGSRVSADKILKTGYKFHFPDLKSALTNLIKDKNVPQQKI